MIGNRDICQCVQQAVNVRLLFANVVAATELMAGHGRDHGMYVLLCVAGRPVGGVLLV